MIVEFPTDPATRHTPSHLVQVLAYCTVNLSYLPRMMPNVYVILALSLALIAIIRRRHRRLSSHPSAPGPGGPPFVGVAWQIPSDKQWLKFHDWIERYGT